MSRGALARLSLTLIVPLALAAAARGATTEIRVLSNRADLVSGGDALVEVKFPAGADPATAVIRRGGADVTSQFAVRPNGRFMGLLSGLAVGDNVLTATLPDQTGASLMIRNHPIEGPGVQRARTSPLGVPHRAGGTRPCRTRTATRLR